MLNWHSNTINSLLMAISSWCQVGLGYWANGRFKIFRIIASISRLASACQEISNHHWHFCFPLPPPVPHCSTEDHCSLHNRYWAFYLLHHLDCVTAILWLMSIPFPWVQIGSGLGEHSFCLSQLVFLPKRAFT